MPGPLRIDFQPAGRRIEIAPDISLLAAAQLAGVDIKATCGGIGVCGSCRVRLVSGSLSAPHLDEQSELGAESLGAGYRLACRSRAESDVCLEVPPDSLTSSQRLQLESAATGVPVHPWVVARDSAAERTVVHEGAGGPRVVAVLPRGTHLLGFAADIGTTKVAMYLVDLESGATLGAVGALNPQITCGEDVISRLAWADQTANGGAVLQQRIIACLAEGIADLCGRASVRTHQIVDAVVVGNTAMHHFFAGLPTHQLGVAPYRAAITDALAIPARRLGLPCATDAEVYLPPNIAAFVGADHVAMLLASEFDTRSGTVLALDIGTNTEMSLLHRGRLFTCSCPSGPAFEGAHLAAGMRAAPGAIEAVRINGHQVLVRTIDGRPAAGICGSGILDAVAEMLAAGMLDERGNIRKGHPLACDGALVLAPAPADASRRAIAVHRRDVLEIQLAKATIESGIGTLLAHVRLAPDAIDQVIIAGAFGSYLDVRSAMRIGMFPHLAQERFHQVGNAAGAGARQMLLSRERRGAAERLARRSEYLELSSQPDYTARYLRALWL